MKKKVLSVCLVMAMTICALPLFSACSSKGEIVYTLSGEGDHYVIYASATDITDEDFENILPYYSEETDPETGEMINPLPVTSIAALGFFGCTKLKKVVIPDFINNIGYSAFAYCRGLTSVHLPQSLEIIPYGIFGGCPGLQSLEIPESVTSIADYAFYASCIKEITIPSTVTSMGECVFYRCEYLTNVEIYADIEVIPYGTFCSCTSLKEVTLPASIKEIQGYALVNGDGEVITEDDIIYDDQYGVEPDTENPNYTDNVQEKFPAFFFTYVEAGSNDITFDYELEKLYYMGTEEELNKVVVGESNVCLTESTKLEVFCMENGVWKSVKWNF